MASYKNQKNNKNKIIEESLNIPHELLARILAVAFAIRDAGEKITYKLLSDLAILNPKIRKFLYDLTTFPEIDGIYAKLNPGSGVLIKAIKYLERDVFKIDKEALKRGIKRYFVHENKREIYKFTVNDTYLQTSRLIHDFKMSYRNTWKYEVDKRDKDIVNQGKVIYEARSSSKARAFIEWLLKGVEKIKWYTGILSEIVKEIIRYIEKGRMIQKAEKPSYIYYNDRPLEEFVEKKFRNKFFSVIDITGPCKNVIEVPAVVKDKVDLRLYLSYRSIRIRTYLDGYKEGVDPESIKNHRLQVIAIPFQENGEEILLALYLIDKGECNIW